MGPGINPLKGSDNSHAGRSKTVKTTKHQNRPTVYYDIAVLPKPHSRVRSSRHQIPLTSASGHPLGENVDQGGILSHPSQRPRLVDVLFSLSLSSLERDPTPPSKNVEDDSITTVSRRILNFERASSRYSGVEPSVGESTNIFSHAEGSGSTMAAALIRASPGVPFAGNIVWQRRFDHSARVSTQLELCGNMGGGRGTRGADGALGGALVGKVYYHVQSPNRHEGLV